MAINRDISHDTSPLRFPSRLRKVLFCNLSASHTWTVAHQTSQLFVCGTSSRRLKDTPLQKTGDPEKRSQNTTNELKSNGLLERLG